MAPTGHGSNTASHSEQDIDLDSPRATESDDFSSQSILNRKATARKLLYAGLSAAASLRGNGARRGPHDQHPGKTMSRALIATAALVAITLFSASSSRADDITAVYKGQCAACHGADGTGNTPAGKTLKVRDLHSADVQKATDADLTTVITAGKGKMPAYGKKLSVDQVKALVAMIRTMAPK
jgi:cytochrome c6